MQLELIGSGDAYDGTRTNAALLVSAAHFTLLIDCGPTVPAALFRRGGSPEELDAVYLTHNHPDHVLGLTTLLNWMASQGRSKPLQLICQQEQQPRLQQLVAHAHWPEPALPFALRWTHAGDALSLGPWQWAFYPTRHAVPNHSLLLIGAGGRLFYSGDGALSAEGAAAAATADLLFLECEYLAPHPSHGSWRACQQLARKPGSLAVLYHLDPECRMALAHELATAGVGDAAGWQLAEDGLRWQLPLSTGGAH